PSPSRRPDQALPRPAPQDGPVTNDRTRPDLDDATVEGLGKLSEALETVDQARGLLYGFHQLTGKADRLLQDAVAMLRDAGHTALADDLDRDLGGRNRIAAPWHVQIVEDFDANYWTTFRDFDARARDELADGDRHVYEARMKQSERTKGRPHHEAGPGLDHCRGPAADISRPAPQLPADGAAEQDTRRREHSRAAPG